MHSRRDFTKLAGLVGGIAAFPLASQSNQPDNNSVPASNSGLVNVRHFGAIGDGKSDDTKAIRDAIAASNEKKIGEPEGVYLPPGTYRITGRLTSIAHLQGAGSTLSEIKFDPPERRSGTDRHAALFTERALDIRNQFVDELNGENLDLVADRIRTNLKDEFGELSDDSGFENPGTVQIKRIDENRAWQVFTKSYVYEIRHENERISVYLLWPIIWTGGHYRRISGLSFSSTATNMQSSRTIGILGIQLRHSVLSDLKFTRLAQAFVVKEDHVDKGGHGSWVNAFYDINVIECGTEILHSADVDGNAMHFHNVSFSGDKGWTGKGPLFGAAGTETAHLGHDFSFTNLHIEGIRNEIGAKFRLSSCVINGCYAEFWPKPKDGIWPEDGAKGTWNTLHFMAHGNYATYVVNGAYLNCNLDCKVPVQFNACQFAWAAAGNRPLARAVMNNCQPAGGKYYHALSGDGGGGGTEYLSHIHRSSILNIPILGKSGVEFKGNFRYPVDAFVEPANASGVKYEIVSDQRWLTAAGKGRSLKVSYDGGGKIDYGLPDEFLNQLVTAWAIVYVPPQRGGTEKVSCKFDLGGDQALRRQEADEDQWFLLILDKVKLSSPPVVRFELENALEKSHHFYLESFGVCLGGTSYENMWR